MSKVQRHGSTRTAASASFSSASEFVVFVHSVTGAYRWARISIPYLLYRLNPDLEVGRVLLIGSFDVSYELTVLVMAFLVSIMDKAFFLTDLTQNAIIKDVGELVFKTLARFILIYCVLWFMWMSCGIFKDFACQVPDAWCQVVHAWCQMVIITNGWLKCSFQVVDAEYASSHTWSNEIFCEWPPAWAVNPQAFDQENYYTCDDKNVILDQFWPINSSSGFRYAANISNVANFAWESADLTEFRAELSRPCYQCR